MTFAIAPDQHDGARVSGHRRRQRREILALAVAAGDQHHRLAPCRSARRPWRRRWCLSNRRRSDGRRSRPRFARDGAGPRTSPARERAPGSRGRSRAPAPAPRAHSPRCADRPRAAWRRGRILRVPSASRSSPLRSSPQACSVVGHAQAEGPDRRPCVRHAQRPGIVPVEDLDAGAREDARLRGRVVVHAAVAVEMILATGSAPPRRRVSGWKWSRAGSSTAPARRPAARHARPLRSRASASSTGRPMLPATSVSSPAPPAHRARHLGDRALAVGPGDRQHLRPRQARALRPIESSARANSSMSPTTRRRGRSRPARRASASATPGLMAISSASAKLAARNGPAVDRQPRKLALRSVCGVRAAPRANPRRAPARRAPTASGPWTTPVRPRPRTRTRLPETFIAASASTARPGPASS